MFAASAGLLLLVAICISICRCSGTPLTSDRRGCLALFVSLLVCLFCVEMIGFHAHIHQHWDFRLRNLVYEQLINRSWPMTNNEGKFFVYYLAFWLPPALLSNLSSLCSPATFAFIWSFIGLAIGTLLFYSRLKGKILCFLLVFLAFDSFSDWGRMISEICEKGIGGEILQTWSQFFASIAPVDRLYLIPSWSQFVATFNHAVPLWIFLGIYFARGVSLSAVLVAAVMLLSSSPLGGVAILPFVLFRLYRECRLRGFKEPLKSACLSAILTAPLLLCIGLYMTSAGAAGGTRFTWQHLDGSPKGFSDLYDVALQVCTLFINLALVCIICVKKAYRHPYVVPFMSCLCIITVVWVGMEAINELIYKGGMVVAVIFALGSTMSWYHCSKKRKLAIILTLLLSSLPVIQTISRTIHHGMVDSEEAKFGYYVKLPGGDLGSPRHIWYDRFWSKTNEMPYIFKQISPNDAPFTNIKQTCVGG